MESPDSVSFQARDFNMTRYTFLRAGTRVVLASIVLTLLFTAGVGVGLYFYPQVFTAAEDVDEHDHHHDDDHAADMHEDEHEDHEEEDHVALTQQAFANLGLRLGEPTIGDYWKSNLVPGKVVEIPGRSDLAISAPVAGIVESVNVVPGQSIPTQSPLFTIRLTDEALLAAQARYLETMTQQEVAQQEIARLTPLIQSGAVTGGKKRELEYEVKQLVARKATILQELRGRGMPEGDINQLSRDRILASTLSIFAPQFLRNTEEASSGYSIEKLLAHPGKSISRGDSLSTVAYHQRLYIEGTAFEVDLPTLEQIAKQKWKIAVETSHGHDETEPSEMMLELLRVDNHIDEATQTVRFFIELPNKVTQTLNEDGRQFEQWRFRPGQRLHLRLPVEKWSDQLTLPTDAVVIEGPNVFVFAEHHHAEEEHVDHNDEDPHADEDEHEHEEDVFVELEPIPVRLLYRDDKTVVIANDGSLHDGEQIALNNAYKLYLAMKMQAGGGGGHHHHHDH